MELAYFISLKKVENGGFCLDYRRLNVVTEQNTYQLLKIHKSLNAFGWKPIFLVPSISSADSDRFRWTMMPGKNKPSSLTRDCGNGESFLSN